MSKLHVGCGGRILPGYKHLDVVKYSHIDYHCLAWDIPVKGPTFEEIYSRHFFEHLTPIQANKTLKEWLRVLLVKGKIHMILPNLGYHCKQLFLPGNSQFLPEKANFEHALYSIFGWIANTDIEQPFMEHKWGYTKESLTKLLTTHGFVNITYIDCRECDLEVMAFKNG